MDFALPEEQQSTPQNSQAPAPAVQQTTPKSGSTGGMTISIGWLFSVRVFLIVVIIMQAVIIYFFFNPPFLAQQNFNQQIVDEISQLTNVNPFEDPVVTRVADAQALKSANEVQAQVYANAEDGDYVIGFSDKVIIYRRETKEIVYEGESPGAIETRLQQSLTAAIIQAGQELGLLPEQDASTPQLRIVNDVASLQSTDPEFYAQVQKGDVIAIFSTEGVIMIYRPDSNSIIKSGNFQTEISAF